MNDVKEMGRATKEAITGMTTGKEGKAPVPYSRITLAVDRFGKDAGTDFIPCIAFGRMAEILTEVSKTKEKIVVDGRLQSGSYTDKEGKMVYTLDVVVEKIHYCESKKNKNNVGANAPSQEFMNMDDVDMPFE